MDIIWLLVSLSFLVLVAALFATHIWLIIAALRRRDLVGVWAVFALCFWAPAMAAMTVPIDAPGVVAKLLIPFFAPYIGLLFVLGAAAEAPSIALPALAVGALVGGTVFHLTRRALTARVLADDVGAAKMSIICGFLAMGLASLTVADGLTFAVQLHQAQERFSDGYCITERRPFPAMVIDGSGDYSPYPHAMLVDGVHVYHWSFAALDWVESDRPMSRPSLSQCGR